VLRRGRQQPFGSLLPAAVWFGLLLYRLLLLAVGDVPLLPRHRASPGTVAEALPAVADQPVA
jgi:hypothetical protein